MHIKDNQEGLAHHLVLVVLVAILVVGGSGMYVYKQNHKTSLSSQAQVNGTKLAQPLPTDLLTTSEIQKMAADKAPSKGVKGIDLENQGSTLVYRVTLSDNSFLLFNAKSGVLISKGNSASLETGLEELPATLQTGISFDKARSIALAKHSGTIRMLKLEKEQGVLVFSVRFTDGTKIDINATTGEIFKATGKDEKTEDSAKTVSQTETEKKTDSKTTESTESGTDSHSGSDSGSTDSNTDSGGGSDTGGH